MKLFEVTFMDQFDMETCKYLKVGNDKETVEKLESEYLEDKGVEILYFNVHEVTEVDGYEIKVINK